MATVKKKTSSLADHTLEWPFGRKNYVLMAVSLIVIILGFILLWQGDISFAPILLVVGYGLIPFAIMAKGKPEETDVKPDVDSGE